MRTAIVLISHGTVDSLSDLTAFVTNIRRGHAPPPALIAELERRYQAIGGASPLGDISQALASKVEERTGFTTRLASRLWRPSPFDVLRGLSNEGVERVLVLPLAQYSASVYRDAVEKAREQLSADGMRLDVRYARNWGLAPALLDAFAAKVEPIFAAAKRRGRARLLFTAHSLPLSVVAGGDPYEEEVRASAKLIAERLGLPGDVADPSSEVTVAFQSQGATIGLSGSPIPWLGPDLQSALQDSKAHGFDEVVAAPIGFLADHVEILYDLDVEAKSCAARLGLVFSRTASLNADDALVDILAGLADNLLRDGGE